MRLILKEPDPSTIFKFVCDVGCGAEFVCDRQHYVYKKIGSKEAPFSECPYCKQKIYSENEFSEYEYQKVLKDKFKPLKVENESKYKPLESATKVSKTPEKQCIACIHNNNGCSELDKCNYESKTASKATHLA